MVLMGDIARFEPHREFNIHTADHLVLTNVSDDKPTFSRHSRAVSAQIGEPSAFAELYATYSRRLYKTIVGITRNSEDAEDALQDTFLRAHLALHTFEGRSSIYSWLTRIAINSALMILRRRRACPEVLFDSRVDSDLDNNTFEVQDTAPNPEEVCDRRQHQLNLLRAIRTLNPDLRGPIHMRMTKGSSVKEISQTLDISEATAKARLYRARLRLSAMSDLRCLTACRRGPHSNAGERNALSLALKPYRINQKPDSK